MSGGAEVISSTRMTVGVGRATAWRRFVGRAVLGALALAAAACGSDLFGREYEYEEEIYLKVDGSATVVVNASLAALSALRGAPIVRRRGGRRRSRRGPRASSSRR